MDARKWVLAGLVLVSAVACRPVHVVESPGHGAYPAEDREWGGGIRGRIDRARASIDHGIRKGTLTRHEARDLEHQLDEVMRRVDYMLRDGRLNFKERARIDEDLDRLERNIKREKRDDDRRRW